MRAEVRVRLPEIELKHREASAEEVDVRVNQGDGGITFPEVGVKFREVRVKRPEDDSESGDCDAWRHEDAEKHREVPVGGPNAGITGGDGDVTLSERHNERPDGDRKFREGVHNCRSQDMRLRAYKGNRLGVERRCADECC